MNCDYEESHPGIGGVDSLPGDPDFEVECETDATRIITWYEFNPMIGEPEPAHLFTCPDHHDEVLDSIIDDKMGTDQTMGVFVFLISGEVQVQ